MDEDRGQGLRDRVVTITGRLASMSREEAILKIVAAGGQHVDVPSDDTAFVVVGGDGPPLGPDGRPTQALRKAHDLLALGRPIQILDETEFLPLIKPPEDSTSLQHLYTIAQLGRILGEPLAKIRGWVRQELIRPIKVEKRLCYFEFGQVVTARRLQQLTRSGISPSRVRRSLSQIAAWLGKPAPNLSYLEALERGGDLLVRLDDGRLADPSGQLLLDFTRVGEASADDSPSVSPTGTCARELPALPTMQPRRESAESWFRIGIAAEEEGNLDSAIEAYQLALRMGTPQPEVCFNLGNTFYAMDRNAEAAACFIQATEIDTEYVEAWNNLGNALAEIGKHEGAISAYRRALDISPHYADAHYNLAETMALQDNFEGAREHWIAYLQQDPNSQWACKVRERLAELK